jgi:hypothetical protein
MVEVENDRVYKTAVHTGKIFFVLPEEFLDFLPSFQDFVNDT